MNLMVHHLHDGDKWPPRQGSVYVEEFKKIVRARKDNDNTYITFDDLYQDQIDLALPIIKKRNLTALWFPYTNVTVYDAYKEFQETHFSDINEFYELFFDRCGVEADTPDDYLSEYSFYTAADKKFRYLRNDLLTKQQYKIIMDDIMSQCGATIMDYIQNRINVYSNIQTLAKEKQIVGLHSHNHFTRLHSYIADDYLLNYLIIKNLTGTAPETASYPHGLYNDATVRVFKRLGIKTAYCNKDTEHKYPYHIARKDIACV